ncbi:CPBP family intramembrane glutamic endopeptidase [Paramicrobacterium fandaimingii]|uniref:CPBP family intramembrane glutamic endopeptidase n=1 Tax=Paramicrobacterium fandaimingii TaxID=2708079 RepID=UPI001F43C54C|nr:CPBP family intramembrane glutamic endopeptidase [Microbacterium fandaimingii]
MMNNLDSTAPVTRPPQQKHTEGRHWGAGMRLLWQLLAVLAAVVVARLISAAVGGHPWLTFGIGLATGVLAIAVYAWVVRRTEHRAPAEVGLKAAAPSLGWSAPAGIALFGAVIALISIGGYYTINGLGDPATALGLLGFMAGAAVSEELIFRGILFRIVEEWTGTWIALVLVGLLFGLVHLLNANATLVGALAIAIEAGGMLTAAYIATRKLWVPIGLHFGWNLAASAIFSTELSGSGAPTGLLDATTSGPALLTGGDFGPEASIYAVVFGVLATAAFMWVAYRRGYVVPVRGSARKRMIEAHPW